MTDASAHSDLLGEPELLGGEYKPPARPRPTTVIVLPPNPAADTHGEKFMKVYTQNKIRQAFHQLAINNLDAVQTWLHTVAADSPAKAVELFLELAKFSLPQLKETAVTVTQNGNSRTFTSSEDIKAQLDALEHSP